MFINQNLLYLLRCQSHNQSRLDVRGKSNFLYDANHIAVPFCAICLKKCTSFFSLKCGLIERENYYNLFYYTHTHGHCLKPFTKFDIKSDLYVSLVSLEEGHNQVFLIAVYIYTDRTDTRPFKKVDINGQSNDTAIQAKYFGGTGCLIS